ncbi:MAG: hypothetical protein AAGJ74_07160 [Pseudomonadota bacterium]
MASACLCVAASGASALSHADHDAMFQSDMTVLVHRGPDSVELYLSVPAELLPPLFALPNGSIASADGTVDFDGLRNGTWEIGDAAFEKVNTEINGQAVTFEAMSLMVHPETSLLPMSTPIEGMIAIAVCAVPTPATPPVLSDLHTYVGYITYTDTPQGTITLEFPETGRADMSVLVREFENFEFQGAALMRLGDGAALHLPGRGLVTQIWLAVASGALVVFFAVLGWAVARRKTRSSALGRHGTVPAGLAGE